MLIGGGGKECLEEDKTKSIAEGALLWIEVV